MIKTKGVIITRRRSLHDTKVHVVSKEDPQLNGTVVITGTQVRRLLPNYDARIALVPKPIYDAAYDEVLNHLADIVSSPKQFM